MNTVDSTANNDDWTLPLDTNGVRVTNKYTRAQANLLPERLIKQMKPRPQVPVHPAKVKATGYSGADIPIKGQSMVKVQHEGQSYYISLLITRGDHQPLLGLKACEKLNLVKRVLNINKDPQIYI